MKYRWDKKYLYWGVTAFLVIFAAILVVAFFFRFDIVTNVFGYIMNALVPVFYGIIIAFLVDPIVRFIERCFRRIFKKKFMAAQENPIKKRRQKKRWRVFAILIALFAVILMLAGLLWLVIPQLVISLSQMVENFQGYYNNFTGWINDVMSSDSSFGSLIKSLVGEGFERVNSFIETSVMPYAQGLVGDLASGIIGVIGTFMDVLIGFIIAIYFLYHKERFIAHVKMFLYSFMKKDRANSTIRLGQDVNKYFGGFLTGKILDSMIIGVICFIVMSIFQFDYALLISVIVGVTNIIPFFGPFIGAIPSAFLLFMIDPMECLYFIIWVLILQQLDGNVIGPLVLGSRTGVSGFWVITSITVFGSMFGVLGIIIAVPLTAVLLVLIKRRIAGGLKRRKMDFDTKVYMHKGTIYENDFIDDYNDDSYKTPVKSAEIQRPPEAHEQPPQGKLVYWGKALYRKYKKKKKANNRK